MNRNYSLDLVITIEDTKDTLMIVAEDKKQKEDALIQAAMDAVIERMEPLGQEDRIMIIKAFEMAKYSHRNQRRKSGEPYILHPIEVARICFEEIGLGPTAIAIALLHDTVEDTEITLDDIKREFGEKVGVIVDGLTKLEGTYKTDIPQAENFKKVLRAMLIDVRVVLIKMADRLHNMRTLKNMPHRKQLRIAGETNYIYAPLAHRLGLYNVKTELQDLTMKVLDKDEYIDIAKKLAQTKRDRQAYIEAFIKPLEEKLKELDIAYRLHGRPKSISSIANKIRKKNVPFEEIYDLFAVRIILDVPVEMEKMYCWQVYSIVTDVHKPIPERLKDWVSTPKSNGYESLHTTVIGPSGKYVEVQIRSERMDEIAERGFAAHWKYKGIKTQQDHYGPWLDSMRELLDDEDRDNVGFLNDLKSQLFKDEVFVYTPKGDMKVLPSGSTALDFAFSIHTDVGYRATSVMVNNKLETLGYVLKNGDQVSVKTNKNQNPNKGWLDLVVTSRARSKIKASLKEERRKHGEFGKEWLERKFVHLKIPFEENVDVLMHHYSFKNRPDLYCAIVDEEIDVQSELKKFDIVHNKLVLRPEDVVVEEPAKKPKKSKRSKSKKKADDLPIILEGANSDSFKINLAPCCQPVMGDPIFGFITTTNGVNIHRNQCKNAEHLMTNYGYRILQAEWANPEGKEFLLQLVIRGLDQGVGVIQQITNLISKDFGLNITALNISGEKGYFEGQIKLYVTGKDQAKHLMTELKKLEGISSVTRRDA